jgi:glyoxylase-like metal-dependent hydrolase (beta-lactamase superfamily II)
MTYHGKVSVGGTPDVRELAELIITKVAVGPFDNNSYLLRCRATDEQLLIDAANEAETLTRLVNGSLDSIVTTHRHGDHWQALAEVAASTGARTYAGEFDADGIPVATDVLVKDGDVIKVGECSLTAIHLVGHTPGSIALYYDDPKGHPHLFTGDCLFPGGAKRSTHSDTDSERLHADLAEKIFDKLADETWIYPGHGDDAVLGDERSRFTEPLARR